MGRVCNGPSLSWAEMSSYPTVRFVRGPFYPWSVMFILGQKICDKNKTSEFVFIFCCALIAFVLALLPVS